MRDKYGVSHDSHCYPGSEVLQNKLNIQDYDNFAEAELAFSID